MYREEREEVAYFMRRLYDRGLTTASGGNISRRVEGDRVLLTGSGFDKALLEYDRVAVLGLDGSVVVSGIEPSIEADMHLNILRRHPSIQAVVHAHPVASSVFCMRPMRLNTHLMAESYAVVGDPAFLPYACMGSAELAETVAEGLGGDVTCALMENHGVIAVGETLLEAYDRIEVLDCAARLSLLAGRIDDHVVELDADQLAELDCLMGRNQSAGLRA